MPLVMLTLVSGLLVIGSLALALAQQGPAAPTCDQQVQEQVRLLAADQLVTIAPTVPVPQQVEALGSQIRSQRTEVELANGYTEQLKKSVAQLVEQNRQLRVALGQAQQQQAQAKQELAEAQAKLPASSASPPAN